jgi:hypothetical protein
MPWDEEFTKWVATVDEEQGLCLGCHGDTLQHLLTSLGVSPVEGTNADGEHDVVRLFVRLQNEIFGRDLTDTHAARPDFLYRGGLRLGDGCGGSVDGQDAAGGESSCDCSCGRPWPATDLENARVRLEGKRVHDRGESRRQTYRHGRKDMCRAANSHSRQGAQTGPCSPLRSRGGHDLGVASSRPDSTSNCRTHPLKTSGAVTA